MKKYKTFKSYMQDQYYNELFDAVKGAVLRDKSNYEKDQITFVKWLELEDIHVEGVTFKEETREKLEIRVSVSAEVAVEGKSGSDYDTFSCRGWYCVFFSGILDDYLHDLQFLKAEQFSEPVFDIKHSLSQDLVPYLREEDIEDVAEDFLRRHYPKALVEDVPVDIDAVVESLGMKMYYAPLEDNVFGRTYFGTEKVTVYDDIREMNAHEIITEPGTMLVNPNVNFMYNIGTGNNTIIHECVHWDRHRRPFALQRILQGKTSHISCEQIESYEGIPQDASALDWMEWQANQLAPRILMPKESTKHLIKKYAKEIQAANPGMRKALIVEHAVEKVAYFFGVSYLSAKLRLIELGYDFVHGSRAFCDGNRLPAFIFRRGVLKQNQSFVIDRKNAVWAIFTSPVLRDLYFRQIIVYANGMVCLNDPKYVIENSTGIYSLTEYALEHVHECCFVFKCRISESDKYQDSYYRKCFLCRDVSADTFLEAEYDEEHKNNQDKEEAKEELQKIADAIKEMSKALSTEIPGGFGATLSYHMNQRDITNEELAGRCNLSAVTISGYRNSLDPKLDIGSALALCNGLKLQNYYGYDLMDKAGYRLNQPSPRNMAVRFLIEYHMDDTLAQWQEKLDYMKTKIKLPGF